MHSKHEDSVCAWSVSAPIVPIKELNGMRITEGFRKIERTRVRHQRCRDARIFDGRLERMLAIEPIVACHGDASPDIGDHFLVEVHGPKLNVVFK